jgi:tetratricopeptide (TPR) repeat protein
MTRFRAATLIIALSGAFLIAASAPVQADEIQEISQLFKQGQNEPAMSRVNDYLVAHPKDAQGRFLKGLILTEQGKTMDAIRMFNDLTVDFPELPEPYNNLAVLYAQQGQYEKAKIALEAAIRTHPSYATAHENLGDIYAKMATIAYDKALQLDKGNSSAQTKLALVKELFSGGRSGKAPAAAKTEPARQPIATSIAKPAPIAAAPAPAPAAPPPAKVAAVVVAPAKPAPQPAATVTAPETKAAASADDTAEIMQAVNAWAAAWSKRDVHAYLASYAKDFKVPRGESRSAWEKTRKERLTKPKSISVEIVEPKVTQQEPSRATVEFHQVYHSDVIHNTTGKSLSLIKSGDKWLILEERVGH